MGRGGGGGGGRERSRGERENGRVSVGIGVGRFSHTDHLRGPHMKICLFRMFRGPYAKIIFFVCRPLKELCVKIWSIMASL